MKIILSRKGFDSAAGRVASPIFKDGTMTSLPIPDEAGGYCFGDLAPRGRRLGRIIHDLTGSRLGPTTSVHLDPDIEKTSVRRSAGWRPAFGQASAAAAHLDKMGVGLGDLFLFFGWFRRVEQVGEGWRYISGAPDLHVIFGWLIADLVICPGSEDCPRGMERHPHFDGSERLHNRIYIGKSAGTFPRFTEELQLTQPGLSRSRWQLPGWFEPKGRQALSYHGHDKRWSPGKAHVRLETVGRGQEFVLDSAAYPEAEEWAYRLIASARTLT